MDPNSRIDFDQIEKVMQKAKAGICSLPPFSMKVTTQFNDVADDTQNSVFLQKEILTFTSQFTAGKNLPNPGAAVMTHRIHDQNNTNFCASFASTSVLRGAAMGFLMSKGNSQQQITADLEDRKGKFAHSDMMTLLTGCVSPRSLDGIIENSKDQPKYINAQVQIIENVMNRLVRQTAIEAEGWRKIIPICKLFEKYNEIPANIELELVKVFHPRVAPPGEMTFSDALGQNMLILTMVFTNTMTPRADICPHAVTLYSEDQNEFVIKNTYFAEKEIRIDTGLLIYSDFKHNENAFRTFYAYDPNFSDLNYILFDFGFALRFKNKIP